VILSDREILMAHERGIIGIAPLPPWGSKAWTSTALDLTLDSEIRPWGDMDDAGQKSEIDPKVKLRLTSPRFSHFPDEMVKLGRHG
jgi:hypothetical protein